MKKLLIISSAFIVLILIILFSSEYHFNETSVLDKDVEKLISYNTSYGSALLIEDKNNKSFGVAQVDKKYGILYRYAVGSMGFEVEDGKPFKVTYVSNNREDGLVVGIKTAKDSTIKYVAIGKYPEGVTAPDTYSITLEDVKGNKDYSLQEVVDHYALFVFDELTEDTSTFRCFDEEGNLVADKIYGATERYIDW